MKINLKKFINIVIILYPALFSMCYLFSDSVARKMSIVLMLLLFFRILQSSKKNNLCHWLLVVVLIVINFLRFGISYVSHQDFYGFTLLLLVLIYYMEKTNFENLESLVMNTHLPQICMTGFFIVIVLSILRGNGLQVSSEWGVSMPMLFGPFGLPHSTAYGLIVIYCLASIFFHSKNKAKKIYMFVMIVSSLCIVWTGVRSAFLVLVLLLFYDYKSTENGPEKLFATAAVVFAAMYLFFTTDILTNNPIIQKTLHAADKSSGITNGRLDINSYLINIYLKEISFFEKIFGIGMDELRHYMYLRYGTELHAHNDMLNSLVGFGICGFVSYIYYIIKFCKDNSKGLITVLVLLLLAFTNGLYMYLIFVPCIPVIALYSKYLQQKVSMRNRNGKG